MDYFWAQPATTCLHAVVPFVRFIKNVETRWRWYVDSSCDNSHDDGSTTLHRRYHHWKLSRITTLAWWYVLVVLGSVVHSLSGYPEWWVFIVMTIAFFIMEILFCVFYFYDNNTYLHHHFPSFLVISPRKDLLKHAICNLGETEGRSMRHTHLCCRFCMHMFLFKVTPQLFCCIWYRKDKKKQQGDTADINYLLQQKGTIFAVSRGSFLLLLYDRASVRERSVLFPWICRFYKPVH